MTEQPFDIAFANYLRARAEIFVTESDEDMDKRMAELRAAIKAVTKSRSEATYHLRCKLDAVRQFVLDDDEREALAMLDSLREDLKHFRLDT